MQIIKSTREAFAAPVQAVSGIVGKQRQTLPILSNILIKKVGHRRNLPRPQALLRLKLLQISVLKDLM